MTYWRRRPEGGRAIAEIVATIENEHPDEVATATGGIRGRPAEHFLSILRDATTRELYQRLVDGLVAERETS